jgi:hypothetical protein
MQKIRRVGPLSVGTTLAAIYAAMGLLLLPFLLIAGVLGALADEAGEAAGAGIVVVALAIFLPIIYGVFGFISGLIVGALYNLIAGWTGGIEVELSSPPAQVLPVAGTVGQY